LIRGLSCTASDDEYVIYLDGSLPQPDLPVTPRLQPKLLYAVSSRIWSAWTFPRALDDDRIGVAHVQYTIPPLMPCPVVTTIHDVSFKRCPEFFTLKDRLILSAAVRRAARRAARILSVSEHGKRELLDLYGIPPERIAVVYPGVDDQFAPLNRESARRAVAKRYGISAPFILTVGVIQPRKNLPRLLEAFARLKGILRTDHKLVIVGKSGWREDNLLDRIRALDLVGDVALTGYVPYEDLPVLYNAADIFVYPSVYEGFGLPPLEAMACGTPVITGNLTSLPEVVGEAGIMADPYDPDSFAQAMLNVLSSESLRADMAARGPEQAAKFSWDTMAHQMAAVYRAAASDR
jgi:glycosyltransferase involved in cell wall biosynthesis